MNAQPEVIVVYLDALNELRAGRTPVDHDPAELIRMLPEFRHGDFSAGPPLLLSVPKHRPH